ncbi:MAG: hypothetical protein SCALA702_22820 [Melioribacteraceae bacterium]|nr:MAG: hypothetical protein SCALA702_22820 [Melioribacteraceae bacterium]
MRLLLIILMVLTGLVSAQWSKISDIDVGPNGKMAAINGVVYVYGDDVLRSTDNGDTWVEINSEFSDDLYYLHAHNNKLFAIIGINNVYLSEDNGYTWTQKGSVTLTGGNGAILSLYSDGDLLYALSNRASIFKSANEGADWEEILINADGITNPIPVDLAVAGDLMVAAIATTGIVMSTDGGSTWNVKNPAIALSQVAKFNNEIYGSGLGLFKLDSSNEWLDWNAGIPVVGGFSYTVKSVTVVENKMYAAVNSLFNGYIYNSDVNGENWAETTTGLPDYITSTSLQFITYSDGELFTYMYGIESFAPGFTGIYKTQIGASTSVESDLSGLPQKYSLEQNYPNPFNPATKIRFNLPMKSDIRLTVFDMLGRVVDVIASGEYQAGYHEVDFSGEQLSSGLYIYNLSGKGDDGEIINISAKMILMK